MGVLDRAMAILAVIEGEHTYAHRGGSTDRPRPAHRSPAAQVDGIARPRDVRRRTGLPARAEAPRSRGDRDARAAAQGPRTTRPRPPGAIDGRERAAVRARPPPPGVHRGGGVAERAANDRRDRRLAAAHRGLGRQGLPRVRSSGAHRRAHRDGRSVHAGDAGRRAIGAPARDRAAARMGVERGRARTRRGVRQRPDPRAVRSAPRGRVALGAGASGGPDLARSDTRPPSSKRRERSKAPSAPDYQAYASGAGPPGPGKISSSFRKTSSSSLTSSARNEPSSCSSVLGPMMGAVTAG